MSRVFQKIERKISEDRFFIFTAASATSAALLHFNMAFWHSRIAGVLFLLAYLLINGIWLGEIMGGLLRFDKFFRYALGFLFLIYLISFGGAIFIVLYSITPFFIFLVFLILTAVLSFLNRLKSMFSIPSTKHSDENEEGEKIKIPKFCYALWVLCYALCAIMLFAARTGKFILSPWEVIHPVYIYIFLALTFLTVLFIFSKHKIKTILLAIILHSILLHAYLPIVYEAGFGGDKWRHIGAEKWLDEGKIYSPALFGEKETQWSRIGPLKIPAVFLVGNKTSYANMWAFELIFSKVLNVDVFLVDLLFFPIIWSIFIPLLLFVIGRFISDKKIFLLLLSFAPSLFYAFQVHGSITIPVGFGFLIFLLSLIFILRYLNSQEKNKPLTAFLIFFIPMLYLNYVVYFLFFLEALILSWFLKRFKKKSAAEAGGLCLLTAAFIFLIPRLDIFYKLSAFSPGAFGFYSIAASFGQFLSKIFALQPFVPRPDFVSQGDFLYMQMGDSLSPAALFSLTIWSTIISISVWLFLLYGLRFFKKEGKSPAVSLMLILLIVALGNYFVGWYFTEGIRLLSKRLDLIIAFLMMPFLILGLHKFIGRRSRFITQKAKIISVCLFLALTSASTYASGPKLQTVTKDELRAAEYVWHQFSTFNFQLLTLNPCVLANTWPLLALEAVSGREIAAGNFPVYTEYAQPERVQLFEKMSRAPSVIYLEKALEITQSPACYFMTEKRWFDKRDPDYLKKLGQIFGEYVKIGEVYVFLYKK